MSKRNKKMAAARKADANPEKKPEQTAEMQTADTITASETAEHAAEEPVQANSFAESDQMPEPAAVSAEEPGRRTADYQRQGGF